MDFATFTTHLRNRTARDLAREYLNANRVAAFADEDEYARFRAGVCEQFPQAEFVAVAGTANWPFSLNPEKNFKQYDERSDVDTVVVSRELFERTWNAFRMFDHEQFNQLNFATRQAILRHGQDVYSGFLNPFWLVDRRSKLRFEHSKKLNTLSNSLVGYRKVKMFFFRNAEEAVDYYARGFRDAKRKTR